MPIWQLCDAAYCLKFQIVQASTWRNIPCQFHHFIDKQICKQCHWASDQAISSRLSWKIIKVPLWIRKVAIYWFSLTALAKHQYGNYVIQSLIQKISSASRQALKAKLKENSQEINKSQYGRHVLLQFDKLKWCVYTYPDPKVFRILGLPWWFYLIKWSIIIIMEEVSDFFRCCRSSSNEAEVLVTMREKPRVSLHSTPTKKTFIKRSAGKPTSSDLEGKSSNQTTLRTLRASSHTRDNRKKGLELSPQTHESFDSLGDNF